MEDAAPAQPRLKSTQVPARRVMLCHRSDLILQALDAPFVGFPAVLLFCVIESRVPLLIALVSSLTAGGAVALTARGLFGLVRGMRSMSRSDRAR